MGLSIPERPELFIRLGKSGCQGRINNNLDVIPGLTTSRRIFSGEMDNLLQFIEKFLGTSNTESWNQYNSAISKGSGQALLEDLPSLFPPFMQAVTVS